MWIECYMFCLLRVLYTCSSPHGCILLITEVALYFMLYSLFSIYFILVLFHVHFVLSWQGFIQALWLTSVFHKGVSFMPVGHDPMCVTTFTLAARGSNPQDFKSLSMLFGDLIFFFFNYLISFCSTFYTVHDS